MRATHLLVSALILATVTACSRSSSPAEKSEAASPQGVTGPVEKCSVEKLSLPELRALNAAGSIGVMSSLCDSDSFDTLYETGCEQKGTGMVLRVPPLKGQMPDPRRSTDYDFAYRAPEPPADIEVAFNPKRPGLAGTFSAGTNTYCNALGKAAARPDLLMTIDETNRVGEKLRAANAKRQP